MRNLHRVLGVVLSRYLLIQKARELTVAGSRGKSGILLLMLAVHHQAIVEVKAKLSLSQSGRWPDYHVWEVVSKVRRKPILLEKQTQRKNLLLKRRERRRKSWISCQLQEVVSKVRRRKAKEKLDQLSASGSGLESTKETYLAGKANTKEKSSAQAKTKAKEKLDQLSASGKEKLDQLSASGSGRDNIAETPSSWSPSKGEPVNIGGTGVNKEAGFVFLPDWYLDLDGLSSLEIPDDIDSWPVEPAAFLEIPMDDILDVDDLLDVNI